MEAEAPPSSILNIKMAIIDIDANRKRAALISNLPKIAESIGPERTRAEIVPFIAKLVDEDDEILFALYDTISEIGNYLKEFECLFLPILAVFSCHDNKKIRKKAIDALSVIIKKASVDVFEKHVLPMMEQMKNYKFDIGKISMANMAPIVFKRAGELGTEFDVVELADFLKSDRNPLVRKNVIVNIKKCLENMSDDEKTRFLPVYRHYLFDSMEGVQNESIIILSDIVKTFKKVSPKQFIDVILELKSGVSWRTRRLLCDNFCNISREIDKTVLNEEMVWIYTELLNDDESEVAFSAAEIAEEFCNIIERKCLETVIVAMERAFSNDCELIDETLSKYVGPIVDMLDPETLDRIFPRLAKLLLWKGEIVQLNFIKSLRILKKTEKLKDSFELLKLKVSELGTSSTWRVRFSVAEYLPRFTDILGRDSFEKGYFSLCTIFLYDRTYKVRKKAGVCIRKLTKRFSSQWAIDALLPGMLKIFSNKSYLLRVTAIHAIQEMAGQLSLGEVEKYIAESVFKATGDPIMNVKEVAVQCLLSFVQTKKLETENVKEAVGLINQYMPEIELNLDSVG